jgi:hypothetical protein
LKKSKSSDGAARDAIGNGEAATSSAAAMMHFASEAAMRILPWLFLNFQSAGMLALKGNAANAGDR